MRNTPDASWHKAREQEIVSHIEKLLVDPKFVIDTAIGRKNTAAVQHQVKIADKSVDLKRQMSQVRPDRELESQMPVGRSLEATFSVNKWLIFQKIIARLMVNVVPPTKEILKDESPEPMSVGETRRQLGALPPALPGVPTTVVLVSTSGFDADARELAERTSERTVVLVEPNGSGGWSVHTPSEMSGVKHLFDPEPAMTKSRRVEQAIELMGDELITGSISAEKLALVTELPLQAVEDTLKSYAKRTPGLQSKRLDGRLLLFREGSAPTGKAVGGEGMSMLDRLKTLFSRKGDNERKIAFLSERRAALTQQRETSTDEIFKLEKKESELKKEFKANDSIITRKRITAQMVQLRKEIDRRSQLLTVLNQQINVVGTHLHNLELLEQGRTAQLPTSDEIATDAAAAEEMLASLQADSEMADSMSTTVTAGISSEEQELYEELLRESGEASPTASSGATVPDEVEETRAAPAKSQSTTPPERRPQGEPG
jgi:hypothetical protein